MTTDVSQTPSMDYSKKNREELKAICKENGIKGYSGKNKGVLVELLKKQTYAITTKISMSEITIKAPNTMNTTVSQAPSMDYSKKTRDELIAICKEKSIKGYSGKNKAKLKELLKQTNAITTKISVSEITIKVKNSKNSMVAISGNLAEDVLCNSYKVLDKLSTQYFKKKIVSCKKIKKKKSDLILTFDDGSTAMIQLKNGDGGGRGWSFDRRPLNAMPTNEYFKELINIVCLRANGTRKTIPNDKTLISSLLFGEDEMTKPQYFFHTTMKDGKIASLSVCSSNLFMNTVLKSVYENCEAKRTCVHLNPFIYLQRKGGGKTDHSPDDIQAKLRCMPDCMTKIEC